MNEENTATSTPPNLEPQTSSSTPLFTKEKEEEKPLPHQENDILPEEIHETDQDPPEEYISPDAIPAADNFTRTQKAVKELQKEEERKLQKIRETRIRMEQKLKDLQKIIEDSKKRTEEFRNKNSSLLMAKFLQKLSFLRKEANKKRSQNMRANLDKIVEFSKTTHWVTNDDVERLTGVGHSRATDYLNILRKEKKLVRHGKGSGTFYTDV